MKTTPLGAESSLSPRAGRGAAGGAVDYRHPRGVRNIMALGARGLAGALASFRSGFLAGCLGLSSASPSIAVDNPRGGQLAATCAACHRLDGRGDGVRIVGLEPAKLIAMMQAFRVEERTNHIMHAVSLSLSNDEITMVARHLAGLGKDATSP